MASSNTIYFNVKDASKYYDPLSGVGANGAYYLIAARSQPWENDLVVPPIERNTYLTDYQLFDEMIFGKKINPSDVSLMVDRYNWTSGEVYAKYDDQDQELYEKPFFIVTFDAGGYHVFKCLDNNSNSPSTVAPKFTETDVDDNQYFTSDGYHWKYMYTIDSTTWDKFTSNLYIPVIENANVTSSAANGSIDTIVIDDKGQNYYSYTNGHFDSIYVNSNTLNFALSGSGNLLVSISDLVGSFQVSEFVTQSNTGASGYVKSANSSKLELRNINGQFTVNSTITGFASNAYATPIDLTDVDVSSNNGFYTGSSIYIKSGTGAGQVRKISEYNVTGTQRIITIETPFTSNVDLTSQYEIAPTVNIQGDGTGAIAISTVNVSTFGIQSIFVVNGGQNYSYANVTVTGNTGTVIQANTASVRAIIPPRGGHGANVLKELNATKIGISVTFANTDPLPTEGSYRRVAILKEPNYSRVIVGTSSRTGTPNTGVVLTQGNSHGTVLSTNSTTITLENVYGLLTPSNTSYLSWSNTDYAVIANVTGQETTFDQRTVITATYQPGSANLVSNDQVFQYDTSNTVTAFGYVHSTNTVSNTVTVNLTNVKGQFEVSTNVANKYIQTSSADKVLLVSNVSVPPIVPYTGDMIYIENGSAITRSNTQSETIRLGLSFYQ